MDFDFKDKGLLSSKEVTESILKALKKQDEPIGQLIELYLSQWEANIRLDQIKQDGETSKKIIDEVFNKDKKQS